MSLRTFCSLGGWLSSKSVLSHQPYMPAVQVLVQFRSLERGAQTDRWQRGEVDATCHEGPHARLLENYSSLQMKYEPECQPFTVSHHFCV